jgi:hypothetical protein
MSRPARRRRLTRRAAFDTIAGVSARLRFPAFGAALLLAAACGARSPLDVPAEEAPVDAGPDAPAPTCDDAGFTYIYLLTAQRHLYTYDPPTNAFGFVGAVDCPAAAGEAPYSMAIGRGGTAFVLFTDGSLFRLSLATLACSATGFVPDQQGFHTFGMGFSSDAHDPGETLFVAESTVGALSKGLASIDTTTLSLAFVGAYDVPLGRMALTGTGDARLFGFSATEPGPGSDLSEIDPQTAKVITSNGLLGDTQSAYAVAFWGGALYLFTSPGSLTVVTRYDPADQSLHPLGTNPETVVGAGVSTCAPH